MFLIWLFPDINGDEWADVLLGFFNLNRIEYYINDQNEGFEDPIIINLGVNEEATRVSYADLDNDEQVELAITIYNSLDQLFYLAVYDRENLLDNYSEIERIQLFQETSSSLNFDDIRDVYIADFDGDQDLDMFFSRNINAFLNTFMINNGNNQYSVESNDFYAEPLSSSASVAFLDFDNDGLLDFIRGDLAFNNIDIAINNSVIEPTSSSTSIEISNNGNEATLSLGSPTYSGRIVVLKEGSEIVGQPADNNFYEGSLTFGEGDELGSGEYIISTGIESEVIIDGLDFNSTYHIAVFEYNSSNDIINYLTSDFAENEFTTDVLSIGNSNQKFTIFPNPVSSSFTVSSDLDDDDIQIRIYDLSGRIVLSDEVNNGATVHLGILSAGLYTLKLNQRNVTCSKRLIKID